MRSNLWADFGGLLAQAPTAVAQVVSLRADGRTSIVEFPNGSQTVVLGQSVPASSYAFVRNGEIIGLAPSVTTTTIDV
jgi:hypothetical protein